MYSVDLKTKLIKWGGKNGREKGGVGGEIIQGGLGQNILYMYEILKQ